MNYGDHQQQQYMMQQGQRMQNSRMMPVPANMAMQRQQRYNMTMIQPGQQPMQIGPNQYVQAAQMQPRASISINDALLRLPPEVQQMAQQQINAEMNPERKKQIALNIIQTHRMRIPQNYQNSGPMGGSAVMVNMGGNQQVGMTSGNIGSGQIIRMSTSQGGPMPQGPMYPAQNAVMQAGMAQMAPAQVTMQRVASHGYLPSGVPTSGHMVQQFAAAQEQQGANVTLPSYNSPQSLIIQQPSSVGPSMQQNTLQQKGPNSVPSAIYQHHPHDGMACTQNATNSETDKVSEEPLYGQKLEQLKAYQDQIRRIIERNRLDGQQPKPKYERLLEIMEGLRKVDLPLLEKLIVSVKSTVERTSLCYTLLEIVRSDPCNLLGDAFRVLSSDPWSDFRQYSVKVPEEVLALTGEGSVSPSKRPTSSFSGPASKRIKKEDVLPHTVAFDSHDEKKIRTVPEQRITVECSDGSRIELSQEASEQIRTARFRFDADLLPISNDCSEVHVLIENDTLLVPPLRLVVPTNYPESTASIWRDQWSFGGHSLNEANVHFEKRLAMANNIGSISEIINAWRIASEHVIRISGK
uniref:Mediator of RNA polymerase II transcription subunit 15 n=1 Tax=Parascaris univalens TaxID=6257 RepID=A0A915BS90_PARUN